VIPNLTNIASQFINQGSIESVQPYGSGNINATFMVSCSEPATPQFILQRINTSVFPAPELIMRNIHRVCHHINKKLEVSASESNRKWLMPEILFCRERADHLIDSQGNFWRAMSFIDSAETHESITGPDHAGEIGQALGTFHLLVSDLPPEALADTLPGFHNTPIYLRHFNKVLAQSAPPDSPEINFCLQFIAQRRETMAILEEAKNAGKLFNRTIHGDPKVSNIMIDKTSGQAISLIDLDTVKPGLVHYDIGDCLRSACNSCGEEAKRAEQVKFDLDLCRAILTGYLIYAGQFLTSYDVDYLYDAVRIITFELGLRYFSDFLSGNIYFTYDSPTQNLQRAIIQFYLCKSIESQEKEIRSLVRSIISI